ncbi:pollen-specific leucine-rich repeat extensin-like protein 3 [Punica granatum]|uniref:Pollen-specific leucine-rich repeat extensin-like protein 3 n=1 Tax=Punica granatum TaxID=22663 RepID=A0A6P8C6L1_PUNGR|nr:pollen-specific leucine-rich repeat extensin-like protein 3 [Punica granatum]
MAADMAELMALLKGPNRASSSSTPPPGYKPTVDLNPWVLPTHAPESDKALVMHAPAVHLVKIPPPPVTLPTAVPLPPSDPAMLALPPMSIPAPAPIYAAPPPIVFPIPNTHAPVYTFEPLPFQAPQPHISFFYPAPPPINIPVSEPNTPTQAAFAAPPTNCLLETEAEQEQ